MIMENEPLIIIPEDQEYNGMNSVDGEVSVAEDTFEAKDGILEADTEEIAPVDYEKRNKKIFLWGSLSILLLTTIAFGLIHFQYISRLKQIGGNSRQFSDLEYRGGASSQIDTIVDEEEDNIYDAEDMYFDERPYMQRDTTKWDQQSVIAETPAVPEAKYEPGHSVRFKGHINKDDMLFILEESESGKMHGQFYNQTINKAFTVEGNRNGNEIQLRSVGHSNWQFTFVKDGDAYKGVATDGQSTYALRLR